MDIWKGSHEEYHSLFNSCINGENGILLEVEMVGK